MTKSVDAVSLKKSILERMTGQPGPIVEASVFTELYQAHLEAVFNYCLFRVSNRAVAEDLTADIFERAWRTRQRYQPERAAFSTWLFTIARHLVTDWQRRRARRPLLPLRWWQPDERPSPESHIEETEQQAQLRRLVAALKPEEQELIALKFGAGMTNRSIGPLLGKSETAVGSAIHRLMQKLRAQWSANE
jgi:RNA polymerase sigma-70 factor (ECF subfamily)